MTTPVKVSVLMPAYNAEKYIGEAIESILNQTLDKFELIIIDDGSTDKTWEIINEYKQNDSRIAIHKNEVNSGISKTRNKLIDLAKAKYIAWQDADDISLPNRLELQYNFMEENPDVGICGGTLEFFNGTKILSYRKYDGSDAILRKKVFRQSPVSQPAAIIRKTVLDESGLFDENLTQAEDLDLSLRIGKYSRFGNLKDILVRYRLHKNSITSNKLKENIQSTLMVRRRAYDKYGYEMTFSDKITYFITLIFQFIPPIITYYLFNLIRNRKT